MEYPAVMPTEFHILIGVTGSVAAVKAPEIAVRMVEELMTEDGPVVVRVRVLLTTAGKHFWDKAAEYDSVSWERMQAQQKKSILSIEILDPDEEWNQWDRLGDPVMHINLREWADILVVAPLSANTLAKISNGICDNTLTCVVRAWNFGRQRSKMESSAGSDETLENLTYQAKPIILAPAMNTAMWEHPLTQRQLQMIQSFSSRIFVVEPQSKELACGEIGNGALASVEEIINETKKCFILHQRTNCFEEDKA